MDHFELLELPEALIILVISFLPLIDAVKLCSLSKRLLGLWVHSKVIEFDETLFLESTMNQTLDFNLYQTIIERNNMRKRRFIADVHRTLPRLVEPEFLRFSLRLVCKPENHSDIEEWVRLAIARNTGELNLDLCDGQPLTVVRAITDEPVFDVPSLIYEDKALRVLRLNFCGLRDFKFQSFIPLNGLSLTGIFIKGDLVQNIWENCPFLEDLSLVDCQIEGELVISSSGLRLKRLVIRGCMPLFDGIWIYSPSIRYFEYFGFIVPFELRNSEDLVEVVLESRVQKAPPPFTVDLRNVLFAFSGVKSLTLCENFLKVLIPEDNLLYAPLSKLLNLVNFTLRMGLEQRLLPRFLSLLRSSPNIEYLCIQITSRNYMDVDFPHFQSSGIQKRVVQKMYVPQVPISHLKIMKVEGFVGSEYEIELIEFVLKSAKFLQEVIIIPPKVLPSISGCDILARILWALNKLEKFNCASRQIVHQPML